MPKRHQHADVIHAWADGAEIEFRPKRLNYGSAFDWHPCKNPDWHENFEYRTKSVAYGTDMNIMKSGSSPRGTKT